VSDTFTAKEKLCGKSYNEKTFKLLDIHKKEMKVIKKPLHVTSNI